MTRKVLKVGSPADRGKEVLSVVALGDSLNDIEIGFQELVEVELTALVDLNRVSSTRLRHSMVS